MIPGEYVTENAHLRYLKEKRDMEQEQEKTRAELLAQVQANRDEFADKLINLAIAIKQGADIACVVAHTSRDGEDIAFSWSSFYAATHDSIAITLLRGAISHATGTVEKAISDSFLIAPPALELTPITAGPAEEPTPVVDVAYHAAPQYRKGTP